MRLELSPEARLELFAERDHYEAEREGLGLQFVDEMEALMAQIADGPLRFEKVPRTRFRRAVAKRFPFKLVFYVLPDHVRVIAVAPQKKRPHYWKGRS
jgi:plasmid stabilization system protein ParE